MYCAFIVFTVLLGSSVAIAFVLQLSGEEPAASANSHPRCQGESLQSIRKGLLRALNLQTEPRLPNDGLDHVGQHWRTTFSNIAHSARDAAAPAVSGSPESPDGGNTTSLKCCSMASEIFMKDLGWDSWVILPVSVTIVRCALCNPDGKVQCPSSHADVQDVDSQIQVPCCQPTSQQKVLVVYVDGSGTIALSSMQITSSCSCGHVNLLQPSGE
ncbi:gonadal somatic cell derived factor isoform X2 [Labrus bergylta]|uniref:Growth/differentiation factor 5-like n=1 Tax=Labrus bergylta TaxID=56723 RepID=A0A3Q3FNK3_9LABR|nr:growth/differentiation factor 5-like isoform X2 [Labrus bergylta]